MKIAFFAKDSYLDFLTENSFSIIPDAFFHEMNARLRVLPLNELWPINI